MIDKGKISAVKDAGNTAEVIPSQSGNSVTFPLTVPKRLRGDLKVNEEVVYAIFDDGTGVILEKM